MDKEINNLAKLTIALAIISLLLGAVATTFLTIMNPKPIVKYSPHYHLINKPKGKDTVVYIVTKDTIIPW